MSDKTNELLTPDVITFTFNTTVDYVVDLSTGTVKREDNGELAEDCHYIALFREGEFAGEYHEGERWDRVDAPLIERAEAILEEAFTTSTTEAEDEPKLNQSLLARLEILQAALKHLAEPNRRINPTGADARDMADYAQAALDRAKGTS